MIPPPCAILISPPVKREGGCLRDIIAAQKRFAKIKQHFENPKRARSCHPLKTSWRCGYIPQIFIVFCVFAGILPLRGCFFEFFVLYREG
jgi:hypothetical protein